MTKNKLAIITGGTKGIGRAIVEKFAEAGFAIATCSRNNNELKKLQESIEKKYRVPLYYQTTDVSRELEVQSFTAYCLQLSHNIEVLVNNAGIYFTGKLLGEQANNLELMWRTNVASAYNMTNAIAPVMVAQRCGHIFNICSIASQTAYLEHGFYCATKFALYGMTKVLREELKGDGVRVTAVLPGATFTDSWKGSNVNPERLVNPHDVAEAIYLAYQLSPQSVLEEITIRPQLGDL